MQILTAHTPGRAQTASQLNANLQAQDSPYSVYWSGLEFCIWEKIGFCQTICIAKYNSFEGAEAYIDRLTAYNF